MDDRSGNRQRVGARKPAAGPLARSAAEAIVRLALRRLAITLLAATFALAGCSLGDDDGGADPTRPERGGLEDGRSESAAVASATRNTIRIGGSDSAADAAAVARALFPATGRSDRPTAVALVEQEDWQTAIAASVLAGPPIGAPLLLTDGDELPDSTADALNQLDPRGSDLSRDAQVIRVGPDVARPDGLRSARVEGDDPFARSAALDRFFSAARGRPSRTVVLYSGERSEWAMPAAAWAARSGDAALPVKRNRIPAPIRRSLREHERPDVYLLGPERVISGAVQDRLREDGLAAEVRRISGPTPVENAVAFARYRREDFGWGVVVPGYNFTLASTSRPLDAAAAAALGSRGVFAPLLVTDEADDLPRTLQDYFLSVQPGYETDPGQAVYNRVWVLGDEDAISSDAQARLDQVTELIPVQANAP